MLLLSPPPSIFTSTLPVKTHSRPSHHYTKSPFTSPYTTPYTTPIQTRSQDTYYPTPKKPYHSPLSSPTRRHRQHYPPFTPRHHHAYTPPSSPYSTSTLSTPIRYRNYYNNIPPVWLETDEIKEKSLYEGEGVRDAVDIFGIIKDKRGFGRVRKVEGRERQMEESGWEGLRGSERWGFRRRKRERERKGDGEGREWRERKGYEYE